MTLRSRVVTPAVLLLFLSATALGVRGAARGFAAPLAGLEGIGRASRIQSTAPGTEPESPNDGEDPIEPELTSGSIEFAGSGSSVASPGAIKAYLDVLKAKLDELVASQDIGNHGVIKGFERFILTEDQRLKRAEWDLWKSQAIAALPEHLREDSDYRRAIDDSYRRATGESVDEFAVDITSKLPPPGGWDIGGIGFTDIGEVVEIYDEGRTWIALWDEWRAREIASLPETWRNDPNRLVAIDTTYKEMVNQHRGSATTRVFTLKDIRIELTVYSEHRPTREFFGTEVNP